MQPDTASLEQILEREGVLLRPVEGDSMMPLLDQRTDIVRLISPPHELALYDLPLYRRPNGALVLHRVVKIRRKYYVTCGDNRERYERVPRAWVIALAEGRYRNDEYLSFGDEQYMADVRVLCAQRDRFGARLGACWRRIFPPFGIMRQEFSVLRHAKLLLPFCYFARWWLILFRKLKRL